jgi:hypothetical protein
VTASLKAIDQDRRGLRPPHRDDDKAGRHAEGRPRARQAPHVAGRRQVLTKATAIPVDAIADDPFVVPAGYTKK